MITWFGLYLKKAEYFWKNIRTFAFRNRTIFELFFILIYMGEQASLIILVYLWPQDIKIIISLFALIVLTTFSIHKLVMESRIKLLENKLIGLEKYSEDMAKEAEETINKTINSYRELTKKDLNKSKK